MDARFPSAPALQFRLGSCVLVRSPVELWGPRPHGIDRVRTSVVVVKDRLLGLERRLSGR